MCWFIHGAVFGNINADALKTINAAPCPAYCKHSDHLT